MTEVPTIVHQRLRAAGTSLGIEPNHPEPDILNAFAEQALSQTERDNVLAHLVLCADCRDVVVTALPEITLPQPAVLVEAESQRNVLEGTPRKKFLWPTLRSAALAAGIAVAVFLVRPQMQRPGPTANRAPTPAAVQSVPDVTGSLAQVENGSARDSAEPKLESPGSHAETHPQRPASTNAMAASKPKEKSRQIGEAIGEAKDQAQTEPSTLIAESQSPQAAGLAKHEMAPIVRAKPAIDAPIGQTDAAQLQTGIQGVEGSTAGASPEILKQSPQWTIAAGGLNRSVDSGRTWQPVLGPENSLLCYANRGRQIWVGGQAGTLLHSDDGGASWTRMTVARDGQPLRSDITVINAQNAPVISLTTIGEGTWSSADGGKTWEIEPGK